MHRAARRHAQIFREYAAQLGVDLCFQGFEAELAGLPGPYSPPQGALLLALVDGALAGCGAFRPAADATTRTPASEAPVRAARFPPLRPRRQLARR